MKAIIQSLTRHIHIAVATLAALATTSAWADATLLNYMSFDTIGSTGGVLIQKDAGTIDPFKIDGGYVNYTTTENAKLGAHAYQANNGTIGLQDNTSGLVSMSGGWTISFWFHPNTTADWRSFFGFGLLDGNNYHFVKSGAGTFTLYGTSSSATPTTDTETLGSALLSGVAYTSSAWNHIAIVSQPVEENAETVTATLYVNRSSAGTFTMPSSTSLREVLLRIGRNNSGANSAYYRSGHGKQETWFDDFALFGGVLSDTMIATIAAGRSTVKDIFDDYEANKTISISGDTTFTVDNDMAFETITVANTSGEAATLTFTGSYVINATQINVPANVTVKVDSAVSGTPVLNAPVVLSDATATLEIAAPATISKTISGSGKVVVSANAVTFATANTFTGGLTVADGGLAKASVQCGFGGTGTNPQAGTITVENGGTVDVANCYSTCVYSLTIKGAGVDNQGAVICSSAIGETERQITGITLTGDASISCANNWGLIANEYAETTLTLRDYTLEKKGAASFWLTHTTVSGTGTLDIKEGILATGGATSGTYNTRGNWIYTSNSSAPIVIRSGAALTVNNASLRANSLTLDSGSVMSVGNGAYACINNSGTLTANGPVSVAGTLFIGWSVNASFVVGSDVEVTGTGLIHLMSTATITRQASGTITIGPNATLRWINCAWTATAGDIFRGEGTLFLDGRTSNSRIEHKPGQVAFGGILKIGTKTHDANTSYNDHISAYFSESLSNFTGTPTLQLAGATDDADGQLRFGQTGKNTTLSVKNLSGSAEIYPWSSLAGSWNIKTLQTTDTTFAGAFLKYNSGADAANSTLEVYGGEDVHSITLSGASVTEGTATVRDNAKLIFSSTGSWANGTVTVADGGYLEVSNNTSSVASMLDLQSGGTIIIQTVTTTTTTGEGDQAVEETTTSVVPIAAGTVTFPDSGEAVIDISAIPELAANDSVTIISATTTLDPDITKIRLVGKPYSLSVDGNALKVVNDGGLVWDSTNGWNKDVTKYGEATITSPGKVELDGTSLSFDTLTLTGSGTVSFSATGDEMITVNNIVIGSGVTLDASAALSIAGGATITGEGTLNIPNGVTLTLDGVTCSAKITAQNGGTLVTKGTTTLSNTNNNFAYGSLINVLTGKATVNAYKGSAYTTNDRGFHGNITIAEGATFVNSKTESFDCNADSSHPIVVDVYGTLSMGSTRWTLGNYNTIKLHEDATITGTGDSGSNGAFDIENNVTTARIVAEGNATIPANIRIRSKMLVEVSNGKNLTFSGSLIKYGDGSIMEVVSGQVTTTKLPGFKVKIDEGATFTLKDAVWSGSDDKFSGTGTLELLSTSGTRTHTATGSTFAGIVKLSNENDKQCNLNPSGAAMFTARPELIANSTSIHLGDGWLNNLEHPLQVKNLSGSGQLRAQWTSGAHNYLVDTVQERDTDYTGTISCDVSSGNRYVSFLVKGNNSSEIHSLGITQAQNTSNNNGCKASTLTISDYGKVVFKSAAGWGYGSITVGENGYLESSSSATRLATTLTLQDGATIVRGSQPVIATALAALSEGATVKVAFADGVTPADDMVVLSGTWETTPDASRFTFADGSTSLVSGGYTYTFAVSDSAVTLKKGDLAVSIGEPEVVYMADFTSATVTASLANHVEGMTYSLSGIGSDAIAGTVNEAGTSVTFALSNLEALSTYNYTITASDGVSTATKSASTVAATPVESGWINETKATIGTTGTWTPSAPAFGDNDYASLSGTNTFAKPANATGSGIVTLTTVVNFSDEADSSLEIDASAKAAIRVTRVNNAYVYQLWTKASSSESAEWLTVSGPTITDESLEANTTVVFEFNTTSGTYKAKVGDTWLTYNSSDTFTFANGGNTIGSVMYVGSGKFTSLTGEYATADIMEPVAGTNIVVNTSYISQYYGSRTVAEAKAALEPTATKGTNGMNALDAYALGLAPDANQPVLAVSVDENGKFVVTMTKANGTAIEPPSNIELKTKLKVGTSPDSLTDAVDGNLIDPTTQEGAVKYYKAEVDYFAK